jgi:aminopeptidase-like protein/aminoglycoside N3'-acetyltransferase
VTGEQLHALAARLFPITRSIAGPGFRATLDVLEEVAGPLERHRFATGRRVLDWTVPREWELREAWIRDPDGRIVVDARASNLHVVSHSAPVRTTLTRAELDGHLHSLPAQPEVVPYRTSYYADGWGFCLPHAVRERLPDGDYEVCIDAELRPGHVELGELVVPGRSDDEVLFSTYCCHPSMANDELSGPVVAAALARALRDGPPPRLTYRFVFVPETIGAIAFLSLRGAQLAERLQAGYVLTSVGAPAGRFAYKSSRRGDTLADRVARQALAELGMPHEVVDFYPPSSDERQYCSPGYDLPVGCLMRAPFGSWPEYHTSLDDLSFVTPQGLGEALGATQRLVEILEANERFAVTVSHGEPQLGRRGLYPTVGGGWRAGDAETDLDDLKVLLNFCDGTRDLLAAAERTGRSVRGLRAGAEVLVRHDLLRRAEPERLRRPRGTAFGAREITHALAGCGVRPGDTLIVHSDVRDSLRVEGRTVADKLETISAGLRDAVADGTLILPTFTYSFCRGEAFDVEASPSTVGALTEWFRGRPGVRRTPDALFSVAVAGRVHPAWEERLFALGDTDCFGPDSVFAYLRAVNAKIAFYGVDFESCTFVHHVEQLARVPYRYMKTFSGTVRAGGAETAVRAGYNVRDLAGDTENLFAPLAELLVREGLAQSVRLPDGPELLVTDAASVEAVALRELAADPRFLLRSRHITSPPATGRLAPVR